MLPHQQDCRKLYNTKCHFKTNTTGKLNRYKMSCTREPKKCQEGVQKLQNKATIHIYPKKKSYFISAQTTKHSTLQHKSCIGPSIQKSRLSLGKN